MEWFKKSKKGVNFTSRKDTPDNLWVQCPECKEIIYRGELEKKLWVCEYCSYHFRISSSRYIQLLLNENSFKETNVTMRSVDILNFEDKKKYSDRLKEYMIKTKLNDAICTGLGQIYNNNVAIGIMDFSFLGGSMGSVVGEKVSRLIQAAAEDNLPLIIICSSGGARMQEGAFSLMQMAKTSAFLARFRQKKLPFITVLTHPTTGGVTASFAMLGEIIIAEPKALIGFAGPRVIKETIRQELPPGFQRSEFLLEHGFVDIIAGRSELKNTIRLILNHLLPREYPSLKEKSDLYVNVQGMVQQKLAEPI